MGETVQINLRVDATQKKEWEEFLEESGRYSSISGLIRAAVETEITETEEDDITESPATTDDLLKLEDHLERIRKDVRWLRRQEEDDLDISDVAQDLLDVLKPLPDVTPAPDAKVEHEEWAARTGIQKYGPQTTQALADRLEINEQEAQDAVEHLQDQFLPILEVEVDNQRHYFMEE